MDKRVFVSAAVAVLVLGAVSGWADPPKGDSVKVVVEGSLGTIVRQDKTDLVTATIVAGGGEFLIDASTSKAAREAIVRLADENIKMGSSTRFSPRLKVTGQLEFRTTKVLDEKGKLADGPQVWVLVAESVAVTDRIALRAEKREEPR